MTQPTTFAHPRISRETRRLLLAVLVAVAVLWLLARVRFTDGPPAAGPVQPLLGQLAARPTFADLAAEISRVHARLQPSVLVVNVPPAIDDTTFPGPRPLAALRVTNTLAVALLPEAAAARPDDLDVVATDAASGLTILNVDAAEGVTPPAAWTPQRPEDPRYVWATTALAGGVSLRPVFVAALEPITRPAWPGQLWKTAPSTDLEPGSFVFTTTGNLAGLVVDDGGERAIVGGDALMVEIERLRDSPNPGRGHLGLEVQPLSRALASATGSTGGVVVTWVDPMGPAAGALVVGDVMEEADGTRLTPQNWAVRAARVVPGEMLTIRVRRRGEVHEAVLVAAAAPPPSDVASLGALMRAVPGVGSEVLRVVPIGRRGTLRGGSRRRDHACRRDRGAYARPGPRRL